MVYIEINDLKLDNYIINLNILNRQSIGVFSKDKMITKKFLDIISGINKNNKKCLYNEKDIFDNKEFFNSRILLDFSKKYLSTLKVNYLEERFSHKYGLRFDKEKFVKISKELDVRGETEITYVYKFSKTGNTFVNYALISSLDKSNIIVNNPTNGLNIAKDIKYITEGLTNKQSFNTVILGIDNLSLFNGLLDKILVFTQFDEAILFDSKDSLIVFRDDVGIDVKNKLFQGEYIVAINNYSKEEIRNFSKQNIEYKIISIYDIEKYIKIKVQHE